MITYQRENFSSLLSECHPLLLGNALSIFHQKVCWEEWCLSSSNKAFSCLQMWSWCVSSCKRALQATLSVTCYLKYSCNQCQIIMHPISSSSRHTSNQYYRNQSAILSRSSSHLLLIPFSLWLFSYHGWRRNIEKWKTAFHLILSITKIFFSM